jgi:ABC-type protease/lipase transport system fused ATPase/permease subunit
LGLDATDVFDGSLSIGALVAFNMISGRVTGPLIQIVGLVNEYQEAALAVKILGIVMLHHPERDPNVQGTRPPITGKLEFSGVTLRYSNAASPALDNVSFDAQEGQVIGIVAGARVPAQVVLTSTKLGALPDATHLIAGMTLTAEIKVGSRRVISYFLHPVLRGFSESIREP